MSAMALTGIVAGLLAVTPTYGTPLESNESARSASSSDRAQQLAVSWDEPIVVAAGGGHRGPWRMNRSEWDFVDDPTVAINEEGFIGVAWAYHNQQDILFQLFSPHRTPRFEKPVNVSGSSSVFSWMPRMILTDGEKPEDIAVYLLWQEIVFSGGSHGGEIFFARSTDGGESFTEPINLSSTTAGAGKGRLTSRNWHNGSYDIIRTVQGHLYVAWTEYEGNLWFSRSTDDGVSFSEPLYIAGGDDRGEKPARGPSLALHDDRILLAWTVGEEASANIHLVTSDDGGRSFNSPRAIHQREGHADAPKLAVDGNGTVHLVYAESPSGPFQRYHVRYARASGDDLEFNESREISGEQSRRFPSIGFPSLRLDGQDNLYLMWELYPRPRGRPMALGFTSSVDSGGTFAPPIIVPGTGDREHGFSGSQQGLLMSKLAVNRRGDIAIVNSTFRGSHASRVWLFKAEVVKEATKQRERE